MFESATFKSTLIYMGILSLICFFFSFNWYTIATDELDRTLTRQKNVLKNPLFNDKRLVDEFIVEAEEKYEEAKSAILGRIFITNILIISAGGLGSYYLARRTLEPIEEAHRQQIRFTADASHELRTPLASMRTEIEVALRDKKLNKADAIELLKSNIEELEKLSALSEGLLKLARQDELVNMEMESVSVSAIVDKSIERVAKAAKHKQIKLLAEQSDDKVRANPDALTELFVILLDNAIKYSPEKTSVNISLTTSKNYVGVSVADQGIGISKADQQYIFERFYRADHSRSSQNEKGHGLGLSIAKNIADIHEAKLTVKSDGRGSGTTFIVRLRRAA